MESSLDFSYHYRESWVRTDEDGNIVQSDYVDDEYWALTIAEAEKAESEWLTCMPTSILARIPNRVV